MKIISQVIDNRISSTNLLIEIGIGKYIEIAREILKKNDYQRRRIKSSSTVYSLLKEDLKIGCVIPPIVLAYNEKIDQKLISSINEKNIFDIINTDNLLILDGLQRTYTIIDLEKEIPNQEEKSKYLDRNIRVEIYIGINRIGILYRMLTLNTGQTPMPLRHQIEILYMDYLNKTIDGISFIRQTDEKPAKEAKQYNFQYIIEGYNSYLERDELPISREDILENIKSLEKISRESSIDDAFLEFVKAYDIFASKLIALTSDWKFSEESDIDGTLDYKFSKSVNGIIKSSQSITGFGAAIGKMKDFGIITNISDVKMLIDKIVLGNDIETTMLNLLRNFEDIRNTSKRIGPSQRMYFHYIYRELFNKDSDSFLNYWLSIVNGYKKYQSQI